MKSTVEHARAMRARPTDAERQLWRLLRGRQLGVKFRRQHPVAGYIVDFYCAEAGLAVELDGGGHACADQAEYDRRRDEVLADMGIRVLRFWNPEVLEQPDVVLELIAACVRGAPVPSRRARVDVL